MQDTKINQSTIGEDAINILSILDERRYSENEISGAQLLSEACMKQEWLLKNLITKIGVGAIAGGSDIGKSALLRQIAIATVLGDDSVLGFEINAIHRSVICVITEDDRSAISYLLKQQTKGLDTDNMDRLRFVFEYEDLASELRQMLTSNPADLVIIDCFADVFGADLKDTQKIRTFLSEFQRLATDFSCFFLFLHHTGKRTENNEPSKHNLLSGQGFESKMRLVVELRADQERNDIRHLCVVKANYLPSSMKRESFVLKFDEPSFRFTATGERAPFEFLAKRQEDEGKAKYQQAKDLKAGGYSYEKIAEMIGYASKGSVSKLIERGEKNNW